MMKRTHKKKYREPHTQTHSNQINSEWNVMEKCVCVMRWRCVLCCIWKGDCFVHGLVCRIIIRVAVMINDIVSQYALNSTECFYNTHGRHNREMNEYIITFPAIHFSFILRLNGYITFHAVLLLVAGLEKICLRMDVKLVCGVLIEFLRVWAYERNKFVTQLVSFNCKIKVKGH